MRRTMAMRYANVRAKTETTTRASAKAKGIKVSVVELDGKILKAGQAEPIFEEYRDKALNARDEVNLADMPKAVVSYKGAFPYMADLMSWVCTINPTGENGEPRIKYQDEDTPYMFIRLTREEFVWGATGDDPLATSHFWNEVFRLMKNNRAWAINFGNGRGVIMPIFVITAGYEDLSQMSRADAAHCRAINVERRVSYIDVYFARPLFESCLKGKSGGKYGGFLTSEHAFYAKYTRALTVLAAEGDAESLIYRRLCNPHEATFALTKEGGEDLDELAPYYRMALCFLISAEGKAKFYEQDPWIRKSGEEVTGWLRQANPRLLVTSKSTKKVLIRNRRDAMCLIDTALWGLNKMARMGHADHLKAIPIRTIYRETASMLELEIEFYARGKSRRNIDCPIYTSRNIEELAGKNPREAGQAELF